MTLSTIVSFLVVGAPAPATLAVDGLLVATLTNRKWAVHSDALPRWRDVPFRQVRLGQLGRKLVVRKPVIMEMSGLPYLQTEGTDFVGALWSGPAPAFPRKVTASSQVSPDLRKAVSQLVLQRAKDPQGAAWSAITVDLDGNGEMDRLVRAEMKSSGSSVTGLAWNILVWIPGKRTPKVLAWETEDDQETCTQVDVVSIADFDRDGRYEVVLSRRYIEGNSGEVWSFTSREPRKIIEKSS